MSMVIRQNLMAESALRNLTNTYKGMDKSIQRLSSGLRIVGAEDDAAGLAVREGMRAEVGALEQGMRNANDAISMLQTFDGGAQVIDEKLIRMKELAMQASTGTYTTQQRAVMNDEFNAMREEIDRIARATSFNQIRGIDGGLENIKIHFGPGNDAAMDFYHAIGQNFTAEGLGIDQHVSGEFSEGETREMDADNALIELDEIVNAASADEDIVTVAVDDTSDPNELTLTGVAEGSTTVTIDDGDGNEQVLAVTVEADGTITVDGDYATDANVVEVNIATQDSAGAALGAIDRAIEQKVAGRAHFGAIMNRLENTVTATGIQRENLMAAESQISDADVATEMSALVRQQVMSQAGTAMLAQANAVPEMALQLLR